MKAPPSLRKQMSKALLRGPVMDAWLLRKTRALEKRYLETLLANSTKAPLSAAPPSLKSRSPLKTILFISDFQWEGKELVPELKKICAVEALNLHPFLPANSETPGSAAIVPAIKDFIQSHPTLDPEVIFFYARSSLLSEEVFDLLRRRWSCPLLGMNLDDKIEFLDYNVFTFRNDNYQKWAKFFDLNLSNVRATVDWYADRNLPVYYMPEGFHLKQPPPPEKANFKYEIAFVGSWRYERAALFKKLQAVGVPIEPMGFGWPNSEPGKDPERVYRSSMLNLGIGFASPSTTLTTLKTRDFECPGSGACFLTTYNWELALHYEIGKEILCYRSTEELVEIFSFYRRRPDACLKIAQAAYRRCANEHTWEKRFRALFSFVGILPAKQ